MSGPGWRTHHLHIVEHGSAGWPMWLAFRDHLRAHPADAAEYGRIKVALAEADDRDRPAYRAGKAPFIERILSGNAPGNASGNPERGSRGGDT